MLSRLMTTSQTNPFILQSYESTTPVCSKLVNVHYQENNYQNLLTHMQMGEDKGWILFLAPPGKPNTQFFQAAGIDKSRVLMIDSSKVDDQLTLLSNLLKSSNYCTVVTWVNELTEQTRSIIEEDAQQTNTSCFIYCNQ
ncbi:SulA-like leucine-rich domain-containing protein [Psychromonas arctica]|uniref:SulA-like leucine-rich domain-containing protein n=1 Tax=Psychromonas arctica TaxID=168275 RepID=UPI002FD2BA6C